jgi:hypothetical protein
VDEGTLATVLGATVDRALCLDDRCHCAEIAGFILRRYAKDERLVTDAMNAAAACLDEPEIVRRLLRGIPCAAPDPSKLAIGLARLARGAFQAKRDETLSALVAFMLREPPWAEAVREEWVRRAVDWAAQAATRRLRLASIILARWVERRETGAQWLRDVVVQHPSLLGYAAIPLQTALALHHAAPTAEGWQLMWARRPTPGLGPLRACFFGSRQREAVESLALAIDDVPESTMRVGLARWYVALVEGALS